MSQEKSNYEVIDEFTTLATQIVEKYPEAFNSIEVDKIRCVKITNKDRPKTKTSLWQIMPVKMPIRLDCCYAWYVVVFHQDWEELEEKHKLLLIAEILNSVPKEDEEEGKVNPFDTKGYKMMYRTFKSIDYLTDNNVPHLLKDDVKWQISYDTINEDNE